jgi:hypothetical protein
MSSRKKTQGQARKARQNPKYGSPSCNHFNTLVQYAQDDEDQSHKIFDDFNNKCDSASKICPGDMMMSLYIIALEAYCKYRALNDTSQQFFQEFTLSMATIALVNELNEASDISDFSSFLTAWPWVVLYVIINVYEKRGGELCTAGSIDVENILKDIQCSRGFVSFVHKRNFHNCLESAYNELKTTAQRTNVCCHCKEDKPTKQVKECSRCKVALLYCSWECQLADYPPTRSFVNGCSSIRLMK